MLSTHELHLGHDETDEVDMSFPEDAHTGPLILNHLASVHNLDLSNHDVSAVVDDDSESKTKESSTRSGTHAIDIETQSSQSLCLERVRRSYGTYRISQENHSNTKNILEYEHSNTNRYNPMTWCSSSGGGKDQEPPEFIDTPFYQQPYPRNRYSSQQRVLRLRTSSSARCFLFWVVSSTMPQNKSSLWTRATQDDCVVRRVTLVTEEHFTLTRIAETTRWQIRTTTQQSGTMFVMVR